MKRFFRKSAGAGFSPFVFLIISLLFMLRANGQNINKVEYFIDTDPGFGSGTEVPVAPAENISDLQFTIGLSAVPAGFHTFYVRAKDENGHWSLSQVKMFYKSPIINTVALPDITQAEYFIDTDPGFGLGSNIPVTPSTNINTLQFTVDLNAVPSGFHTLYVRAKDGNSRWRAKDGNSRWSLSQVKMFYKSAIINTVALPDITKAEYFIDTDPGFGMGSDIPVTPSTNINNLQFTIDLGAVPSGFHTLYVRAKDGNNRWSLSQVKMFYKSEIISTVALPDVTKVEYFFDNDPGTGMGTDVPVMPSTNISNLSFTIDLNLLPLGTHTVWIRAKDSYGKWSMVVWNTFTQANAPVSVSIAASSNPVCGGLPVTFTATPVNGGQTPAFQWKVNGVSVGPNSPIYSYTPATHDTVACILTSSIINVTGNPATSNKIDIVLTPPLNAPTAGVSVPSQTQIIWNWNTVTDATGYKWNMVNDFATATDMGMATTNPEIGLICNLTYTRYAWAYNACGHSTALLLNQTASACMFSCGSSFTINHLAGTVAPVSKTVIYSTVANIPGETSKCWITSNLGADHQATAYNDATEPSAGWYWQFDRKQGYKHDGTTRTPNTTWITSIIENSDWLTANDPCKTELGSAWRIPTYSEWYNIDNIGGWADWNGPWNSGLKLHAAGLIDYSSGSMSSRGYGGFVWSTTLLNITNSWYFTFHAGGSDMQSYYKSFGFSLRCLNGNPGTTSSPTVTTSSVMNITQTNANGGGNVTADGGATVTARGSCWSTSHNPAIAGSQTTDGGGTGVFTSAVSGLTENTTYYIRAYATNSAGTAYGNELSFTTLPPFTCGSSFTINHLVSNGVAPVDKTVTYGTVTNIPGETSKCWITSNLGADHQATAVNDATEASAGWYWQFDLRQGYKHDGTTRTPNTNWITSINENSDWTTANDPCAIELGTGWRMPTLTEWTNVDAAGNWTNSTGPWSSDLKLHMAGFLSLFYSGLLFVRGSDGYYWSGTQSTDSQAWLLQFNGGMSSGNEYYHKPSGFSLRCLTGGCTQPVLPGSGTHVQSPTQIIWNWSSVSGAAGYKWNTSNDYSTASDMGTAITKTETGLVCNTAYTRYVWAYNTCGHSTAAVLTQTTTSNPAVGISIIASSNPVCAGTLVVFTATPVNGGTTPVYQWKNGGNSISGATNVSYSYIPVNNDVITCQLTSIGLCTANNSATSNQIIMTVNPVPSPPVGAGNQTVCSNALPDTLSAEPPAGSTVDWYTAPNGGALLQSNSNIFVTSSSGIYYAESRDLVSGCKSSNRTAITLTVTQAIHYFADADGDGYGNAGVSVFACTQPTGYVNNSTDCNDNNPNVYPGAQYFSFTGNQGFTSAIVSPLNGSPYTTFHFEGDYFDVSNVMPTPGYPRLILDYEGNGIYTNPNDHVFIMTPFDVSDTITSDGKRYVADFNSLAYGTNWKTSLIVSDGASCNTIFGPFDYPDILQQPNLSIFANDITFSAPHPELSQNMTVSAVIHNESDFSAQNFQVHLLNQNDPAIHYPDITVSNIPPHGSSTVLWSITTPALPAWCPMQVQVDYSNAIAETNELDNSAVRPFVNGNYPVAGNIVTTTTVSPSVAYSYQNAYITLRGRAIYTDLAVQLPDPGVAGATVDFQVDETGATGTGYTDSEGYFGISFYAPVPVGDYHISGTVTDYTLTGTFTNHFSIISQPPPPPPPPPLPLKPNLSFTGCHLLDVQPVNPEYPGTAVLAANIVNNGDTMATGPIQILFAYATGETFQGQYDGSLSPGQTATVTVSAPLPPPATTVLTVTLDPANQIVEKSETDNITSDNMCWEFHPGVCGSTFGQTFYINQSTNISVTLNVTHLYDASQVKVKFEVSGPGIVGTQILGYGILNNATRNCSCGYIVYLPGLFTFSHLGTYTFTMTADPDQEYIECDESNNVFVVNVNVISPPLHHPNLTFNGCHSLEVQPVNPQYPGTAVLIANVVNNGDTIATGPIRVKFSYSSGEIFQAQYNGSLSPGQSVAVTVSAPLPPPATTVLTAFVDPLNQLAESHEGDNETSDNMCWDFQPVSFSPYCGVNFWDHRYQINEFAQLSVGVFVTHLYDANPVKVKFEVSGPGITGTQILGTANLNNATRNCYNCPWMVSLPFPFTFLHLGTYTFTMTVDPDNLYTECNENNNVLVVTVHITEDPDMRILSQFINPSTLNPSLNEPVSLLVTYENIGTSNVNDVMKLKVLADNVLLDSVYPVSGLASGEHTTIAIPAAWSSDLWGAHVIRAIIDADHQIVETNETNNEATRAIVVGQAANLYFQAFGPSDSAPDMEENITLNARIGNNGAQNCTATVQFYYVNNYSDTIPIGQTNISVFGHDSAYVVMPWLVADISATIVGKIVNTSVIEFDDNDNMASAIIGLFDVSLTAIPGCTGGIDGSLTASASGGVAPYFYSWSNGHIGQTLAAGAGNYTVTVHDNTGMLQNVTGLITMDAVTAVTISIAASVNPFCQGSAVTFTAVISGGGTNPACQWKVNGNNASNGNTAEFTYNPVEGDKVTCVLTSSIACTSGNPVTSNQIIMSRLVINPTISGSTPACLGSGSNSYSTEAGMTGYSWNVSAGGQIVSGSGTNTVSVVWNTSGAQSVSVIYGNAAGCFATAPTVLDVTVNARPQSAGTISGPTEICAGTQGVTYTVGSIPNATSYLWKVPLGVTIASGAGTREITVNFSNSAFIGNFSVRGMNACFTGAQSPNLTVKANASLTGQVILNNITIPPAHQECLSAQSITTAGFGTTFLIEGGGEVTLIASQFIRLLAGTTVQETGFLHAFITNQCVPCSFLKIATSDTNLLVVRQTNQEITTDNSERSAIMVYPNPTSGTFTIEFNGDKGNDQIRVEIYSSQGRKLVSEELRGEHCHVFSLSDRPSGVYLIRVISGTRVESVKVIRN
ncbi:MAG: T9SS type A sorting domain-containing protein [Bacteroidetes bacterium]|nr:T9SS type A sorting domain-containing protein [Bacteroidota bacterium]